MDQKPPTQWTDDEVRAYLLADCGPPESWRVCDGLYGYVTGDGQLMAVADDWQERVERVWKYLRKIGAPEL